MGILNFLKSNNDKQKSIRIKTEIGDKFVNVNLNQTYESLDILSLKIFQKDVYRLFDADYGVIVGRVIGSGVGIPNCRISIFVPIDEEPIVEPSTLEDIKKIEAASIYPYQTVFDKDSVGKIYNLLPKYSKNRNFNGFPDNDFGVGATPKTPVGTFPEKEEILSNETLVYVYDKYLKFTTLTNESGDYILTVPANKSYTVNMSCDITDIGRFSTCPAMLKLEGYPDNFFSENGTKINEDIPLERLPNIDIQNQTITVKSLWSQNTSNSNVGINRLDFNLSKKIRPFITIVGNQFTQNSKSYWGDKVQFRVVFGLRSLCFNLPLGIGQIKIDGVIPFVRVVAFVRKMCTLNGGKGDYEPYEFTWLGITSVCSVEASLAQITEGVNDSIFIDTHIKGDLDIKLFNIKNNVTENDADTLNTTQNSSDPLFNIYSYETDIELYDKSKYVTYQNDGNFIVLSTCNRNKVITNENGDLIPIDDKSEKGVFTSFRGYFYLTNLSNVDSPPTRYRTAKVRLKVPQSFDYDVSKERWIWKHYKFDFGKIYSVAQLSVVRNSIYNSTQEKEEDYAKRNDQTGFVSQTNLVLYGETTTAPSSSPVPNTNNSYDFVYNNFYNHIVDLGDDTPNLIDDEGSDGASLTTPVQDPTKPVDMFIMDYNTGSPTYDGIDVYKTGTTGFKLRICLQLKTVYNEMVISQYNKWSFGFRAYDETIKNKFNAMHEPDLYANDYMYGVEKLSATTIITDASGIFQYFDIIIPEANYNTYFPKYVDTLNNLNFGNNIPVGKFSPIQYPTLRPFIFDARKNYKFVIDAVISEGKDNSSYFNNSFFITDRDKLQDPYYFASTTVRQKFIKND